MLRGDSDVEEVQRLAKRMFEAQPSPPERQRNPNPPARRQNPQRHQDRIQKQKDKWAQQDAVCTRCNQRGHSADSCWVFDHKIECFRCGGTNYLAVCCRSKAKGLTMTFSQQKTDSVEDLQRRIDELIAKQEALKNPKPKHSGRRRRRQSE